MAPVPACPPAPGGRGQLRASSGTGLLDNWDANPVWLCPWDICELLEAWEVKARPLAFGGRTGCGQVADSAPNFFFFLVDVCVVLNENFVLKILCLTNILENNILKVRS